MKMLSIAWHDEELQKLKEFARAKNMNLSSLIRTAVREKLERDYGFALTDEDGKTK